MKDDDIFGFDKFSRNRQFHGNQENDKTSKRTYESNNTANEYQCSVDELGVQQENDCAGSETDSNNRKLIQLVLKQQINHWNGILPDPESFNKYSIDVQNKLIEWNNDRIDAELNNEKALTREQVRNSRETRYINFVIYITTLTVTGICYIKSGYNIAALGFLSLPAISICVNIYKDFKHKDN